MYVIVECITLWMCRDVKGRDYEYLANGLADGLTDGLTSGLADRKADGKVVFDRWVCILLFKDQVNLRYKHDAFGHLTT